MTIISINETNGLHPVKTWHTANVPDSWAVVPEDLVETAFATGGYCEIEVKGGALIAINESEKKKELELEGLRESRLSEMSTLCNTAITSGCDVTLSDGTVGHFALTETDQINISTALSAVTQGAEGFPYHADGELCRIYSSADVILISNAAAAHKLYHTTYFNHLKAWLERAETAEEISAITYSSELPEDLAANMAVVLGSVGG